MQSCVFAASGLTELLQAISSHLALKGEVVGYERVSLKHHRTSTQTKLGKGFKSSHLHDPTDVLIS